MMAVDRDGVEPICPVHSSRMVLPLGQECSPDLGRVEHSAARLMAQPRRAARVPKTSGYQVDGAGIGLRSQAAAPGGEAPTSIPQNAHWKCIPQNAHGK